MLKFVVQPQSQTPYFPGTRYGKQPHNHTSASLPIVQFPFAKRTKTDSFSPSNVKILDRLQRSDDAANSIEAKFGQFVARHAQLDNEYWTAACLRAESHWEGREHDRYVENYKRKFAEQEFYEMKKRYNAQLGEMCKCIVMIRKEDVNVDHNILKSVVGTLDLSVGCLSNGLKFPGSWGRYGYITNLCVAKSSRREGVATSMLRFAIVSAKAQGAEKVFVHVYKNNISAQGLYHKLGFQVVEAPTPTSQFSEDQTYLLSLQS